MAEVAPSGCTDVPFSVKSTVPAVTGAWPGVWLTFATTVRASPYGMVPCAGTTARVGERKRFTDVTVRVETAFGAGLGMPRIVIPVPWIRAPAGPSERVKGW